MSLRGPTTPHPRLKIYKLNTNTPPVPSSPAVSPRASTLTFVTRHVTSRYVIPLPARSFNTNLRHPPHRLKVGPTTPHPRLKIYELNTNTPSVPLSPAVSPQSRPYPPSHLCFEKVTSTFVISPLPRGRSYPHWSLKNFTSTFITCPVALKVGPTPPPPEFQKNYKDFPKAAQASLSRAIAVRDCHRLVPPVCDLQPL
ncbi:hypothetical protein EDD17DRAFT_1517512 [Pisolithus thermaeus]|nr:hypothetical protein EDD17DRAFT_1517512 [Pisolithus thermaeus]